MTSNKQFFIYRASAGTGKTYTLVKEFLKLLISHPDSYRNILAITFTNKAASEMKERILKNLQGIVENRSNQKIDSIITDLSSELKIPKTELQQQAKISLNNILHDYSSFAISTIDSFTAKIVKTFARELGFQPNFEVELDSDFFINEAIDLIIAKVGQDENITKILTDFVQKNLDEERNYQIEKSLFEFVKETWKESGIDERKKLKDFTVQDLINAGQKIREKSKNIEDEIKNIASPIWDRICSEGFDQCLFYKDSGIAGYFKNYSTIKELKKPNKWIIQSINEDIWQSDRDKNCKFLPSDFAQEMKDAFYKIEKLIPDLALYQIIIKDLFSISLLNEITNTINNLYDETGKVYIAEFNKRISDIIKEEPIPFIYERVGTKYEHFFIDEFQDTSDLQWTNLTPLIANSLSIGKFNMIVGDGKQAIYRWRNGNVELFERLSRLGIDGQSADNQEQFFANFATPISLNDNFRSKKQIVEFNNCLFNFITKDVLCNDSEKIYSKVYFNQDVDCKSNEEGYVNITLLQKSDDKEISEIAFEEIFSIINNLQDQGLNLGDIAILARKNKTLSAIAEYLTNKNISISSAESLLLCKNPHVNLLCSLIRYTANNELIADKFYILLWLLQFKKIQGNYHTLLKEIKDMTINEFQFFLNKNDIPIDFQCAKELTLMNAVTDFIFNFKLDVNDVYIRFFMDSLMEVVESERLSIFSFQDWWEEKSKKLSLSIPDVSDSVKMLTIHKAKGLEFPVVILPFLKEKENNSPEKVWVDFSTCTTKKEMELPSALLPLSEKLLLTEFAQLYENEKEKKILDMLNVLYVATTRPERGLFIVSEKIKGENNKKLSSEKLSIPLILNKFVKQHAENGINKFQPGTFSSIFENIINNQSNIKKQSPFIFKPWYKKIDLSSSKKATSCFFNSESVQYGNIVHKALENIITYSDVEQSVNQLFQNGSIAIDEIKLLTEYLNKIVNHPHLKPYYSEEAKVFTESDILLPKTTTAIRPDRIVFLDNKVIIIDYKTGKQNQHNTEQVQNYVNILKKMGHDVKHGFLVYFRTFNQEPIIEDVI